MTNFEFDACIDEQIERSLEVLSKKALEYSSNEDRLHNFKAASALRGIQTKEAWCGMWMKHVVSISDMCKDKHSERHAMKMWDEKITDAINYLLLLKCIVKEEKVEKRMRMAELKKCPRSNKITNEMLERFPSLALLAEKTKPITKES